jgi:hypothetical protein
MSSIKQRESIPDLFPEEEVIQQIAAELRIDLGEIFRPERAYAYFGLRHSQVFEKIKAGEIDPPIPLTATGHAIGWTGRALVIHHWRRLQLAAARKRKVA